MVRLKNKINFIVSILCALSALSIASCSSGLDIEVDQGNGQTSFHVFSSGVNYRKPCVNSVSVLDGNDLIWSISSSPKCVELKHLVYGEVPPGFSEYVASRPLVLGRNYFLRASGYGWVGHAKWTSKPLDAQHKQRVEVQM